MKKLNEELYIEIFKDIIRNNDDYGDKAKCRKHNAAANKLFKLTKSIADDKDYLINLYTKLLNTDDLRLQEWIAWECLNNNVMKDVALKTLKAIGEKNPVKKESIELILKMRKFI